MNIALLLSGGNGMRLGADIPKQYIEAGGKPVIFYSLKALFLHEKIDRIQIVADRKWQSLILECMETMGDNMGQKKFRGFSAPGENRQLSIWHGLEDIGEYAKDSDYIFIHDAARPLLSKRQITECIEEVQGHDGLVPVLPMKDTVYTSTNGMTISALLNRSELFAGQAPEIFRLGPYREANKKLLPDRILEINGSTEPAVLAGLDVVMLPGDEGNFKITTQKDLERFREMVLRYSSMHSD